jgi:phage terminase large subunit-like protein
MLAGIAQGYQLNGPIKGVERKLFGGSLWHAGQPLMDWNVGNAKALAKGNAVLITKEMAGTGKIDALMALFNAASLMSRNPVPANGTYSYTGM